MKVFKVLKYIRNYWNYVIFHIIFNFFSIVFNVFSLTLVIPFLSLLFGTKSLVTTAPELKFDTVSLLDNFYYYISQIIIHYGKTNALLFICSLVIIAFLLKNLFRYLAQFVMAPIRSGIVRDLRKEIYYKILNLPILYFSEKRKGDIISRMTVDVQEIEWAIMSSLEVMFREPFTILVFMLTMIFMSPQLTIFVLLLLPLTALIIGRVGKSLKKTSVKQQYKMGFLLSIIEETLGGLRIIFAFNAQKENAQKFDKANVEYMKLFTKMTRKRDLSSPLSEFLAVIAICVIIWFGGNLVLKHSIGAEFFIGYIVMFSQIISPSKAFSTAYYNVQKGLASIERISAIIESEEKIAEKPEAIAINDFKENIEYKEITFAYKEEPVLNNISLTINKGQTIALVGQSGAGKSTLVDLLPRFYDFNVGDILIDGVSIKDYKIFDLRNLMGIVTQESILFNDTVSGNIAFGNKNRSQQEIENAARVANAHDFIMEMPEGYNTVIGDRGNKLSGGQKQRLTIARALLKNPPILLLDEATSSLDTESERLVQDALYKLMQNRTSIVIAHRLSTIQHADLILVLEKGRIIEKGTHSSLLELNGTYRKLHDLQTFA